MRTSYASFIDLLFIFKGVIRRGKEKDQGADGAREAMRLKTEIQGEEYWIVRCEGKEQ